MAIQNIRKSIEGIYAHIGNLAAREKSDKRFVHIYDVKGTTFAKAFESALIADPAIQEMAGQGMSPGNIVKYDEVYNATKYVIKNHKSQISRLKHRSIKTEVIGSDWLIIYRASGKRNPNIAWIGSINADFKTKVFNRWKKKAEMSDVFNRGRDNTPYNPVEGRGKGLDFSHSENTNVANATLLNHIEAMSINADPIYDSVTENVAEKIFALLGISWRLEQDPVTGKMEWIIEGELAGSNPGYIAGKDLGPEWEQFILDKFDEVLNGTAGEAFKAPDFVASVPFNQQILDNEVNTVLDYYKSVANSRILGRPKKHKKTKRSNKVRNKARAPKNKTTKIPRSAAVPSMRRERGSGRQASTQDAAFLAQLTNYINSRLTARVEKYMGQDGALKKDTGRFSESVELLSLHQAAKTVVAKYTYLLSPYQTFENTGRRRWRLSYNPKTLIAKSIRSLALEKMENKLTVRRV